MLNENIKKKNNGFLNILVSIKLYSPSRCFHPVSFEKMLTSSRISHSEWKATYKHLSFHTVSRPLVTR